jgi:molybdate-binding protein
MPIVGGSHDQLLEWALRESGSGLATLPEGSEAGLRRFVEGELVAAAIHLHVFDENVDANLDAIQNQPILHDSALIAFARREQGLIAAHGNPIGIAGVRDIADGRARVAVRPEGAGAQLLLKALLLRAQASTKDIKIASPPCPTGPDIAQAIRAGRADCGIATRAVAHAAGLDFIPLLWERFDLVVRQRQFFRASFQKFFSFLKSPEMQRRAAEMGGYDIGDAGSVRFAP